MKTGPNGIKYFYKHKIGAAIFMAVGVLGCVIALSGGISFDIKVLGLLAFSAVMIGVSVYMFLDKRPYVTLAKESIEILPFPAVSADNIQRISLESYIEKVGKDARPVLKEYIGIYVNDLSVFAGHSLRIKHNKPATPFYIRLDSISKKEAVLLKESIKNNFGEKVDMRSAIHRAGDAIADVANAAKNVSEAFSTWKENADKENSGKED